MNYVYMVDLKATALRQSLRPVGISKVASIDKCSPRKFVVSLCLIYFFQVLPVSMHLLIAMYFKMNRKNGNELHHPCLY